MRSFCEVLCGDGNTMSHTDYLVESTCLGWFIMCVVTSGVAAEDRCRNKRVHVAAYRREFVLYYHITVVNQSKCCPKQPVWAERECCSK